MLGQTADAFLLPLQPPKQPAQCLLLLCELPSRERILSNSRLIALYPANKMCGVFSNRSLAIWLRGATKINDNPQCCCETVCLREGQLSRLELIYLCFRLKSIFIREHGHVCSHLVFICFCSNA